MRPPVDAPALPALAALIALLGAPPAAAEDVPLLPAFDPAAFAAPGANLWMPLDRGLSRTLYALEDGAVVETNRLTNLGAGPVILGVATVAVLDEAWEGERLVERTLDYFAADAAGNVWYFGEDVTNFRYDAAGRLTGTDDASAWRAGENGALPGIVMPAAPVPGSPVLQEHAPAEAAMDWGAVVAVGLTLDTPAGRFADVVQIREGSTAEPDLREFKFHAPGIGLIRAEEDLDEDFEDPELVFEIGR